MIAAGLANSQACDGARDADDSAVIQIQRLLFRSLDEQLLVETQLEERRRQQESDRWVGRAIGAGLGLLCGGLVDGFDMGDLTTSFVGGALGGLTADGLNHLSDQELNDLGLQWIRSHQSFLYHRRRHGEPRQRVLVVSPASPGKAWQTGHGVRFRDGYVAVFSPQTLSSAAAYLDGTRTLNGHGFTPDPEHPVQVLGSWPCSDGRERPLELMPSDLGNVLLMAAPIPHHSIY